MARIFITIFVYIFCLCPLNLGKESDKTTREDCSKCRSLSNSFNHWLEKTSRGKHEGGDAAWEESKLKNYARSEMRLVEIQEKLCSDLKSKPQDHCYAFAEETESLVEKWWHEESPSIDLFTWLCINELKYCCPKNFFGDQCQPCPVNDRNEICNSHGKCDGEGTRSGNGSCICKNGYDGDACDKCKTNYFYNEVAKTCDPCHKSCDGCHGGGAADCAECADGWRSESGTCVDVNECLIFAPACQKNEYCKNTEGSFLCKACHKSCETCKGAGPGSCSSCFGNDLLWSSRCLDDDEQQNLINQTFVRIVCFCVVVTLSLMMFRKYVCVTSIFVLSTTVLYLYLEIQQEGSLLRPLWPLLQSLYDA
ncbi:cysteine-rich with EGF-like domain protein 2 [Aricia agestis]|uniref:cysteine-rich with EGF-like domain protein 2 n=1 Tax=Aricia agestis TaxID=91739 RepID=UPI001C20BE39|nr:cysteine-rich with EGF-like domain protein 2 [Aricia agestis]